MPVRAASATGRIAAALAALLVLFALCAAAPPAANAADCTTGGSSCTPGSGYTSGLLRWSCGINTLFCYYAGTTSSGSARSNNWGWGEASYSAGGITVCVQGSSYFVGCATGLARACYYASCDDQDLVSFPIWVRQESGILHTIDGQAAA